MNANPDTGRLRVLYVTPFPSSPPHFGAQARIHGLMANLARRHEVSAVSFVDPDFDPEESGRAMREYCRDVILVPNPNSIGRPAKRALQLRSLVSARSFEHHLYAVPAMQTALDRMLRVTRFDVVNIEFPHLARFRVRQAPPGASAPAVVLDVHEIAYDLARQLARHGSGFARRVYGNLNWPKVRSEEHAAFRQADGTTVCSIEDQTRLLADVPSARTAVIPNAADVEYYRPRPSDPRADDRTVVFFGLMSTTPNVDAATFLVNEIWPHIAAARPDARCRIIGARPDPSLQRLAGPRIEIVGAVDDLRPHLASASVVVVPLRLGGGTRLKILEAMAMGKAIVSTSLGAEGIAAMPGRDIVIADAAQAFAGAVVQLMVDVAERERLGRSARAVSVERYAWPAAATRLEEFFCEVLAARRRAQDMTATSQDA